MRVIKFRAKIIGGDTFAYGELHLNCDVPHIHSETKKSIPIKKETVGQFTGIFDVEGYEIYDGDIIKSFNSHCIHIIHYDDSSAQFKATEPGEYGADCTLNQDWVSRHYKFVAGNIYDNQHLIEAYKKKYGK